MARGSRFVLFASVTDHDLQISPDVQHCSTFFNDSSWFANSGYGIFVKTQPYKAPTPGWNTKKDRLWVTDNFRTPLAIWKDETSANRAVSQPVSVSDHAKTDSKTGWSIYVTFRKKLKLKTSTLRFTRKIILHGLLVTIIPVKGKDHDPHISSTNLVRRPNIMYYILLSILASRRIKDIAGLRQPRGNVSVSCKLAATIL